MTTASGYAVEVAPNRRSELLAAISSGDAASEAVRDFNHRRNALLICLLSFETGAITMSPLGPKVDGLQQALRVSTSRTL